MVEETQSGWKWTMLWTRVRGWGTRFGGHTRSLKPHCQHHCYCPEHLNLSRCHLRRRLLLPSCQLTYFGPIPSLLPLLLACLHCRPVPDLQQSSETWHPAASVKEETLLFLWNISCLAQIKIKGGKNRACPVCRACTCPLSFLLFLLEECGAGSTSPWLAWVSISRLPFPSLPGLDGFEICSPLTKNQLRVLAVTFIF